MQFFQTVLDSTTEFLKNVPKFFGYFFNLVNDTINLIPNPFSDIIKVLLVIATVVLIIKAVKK